MPTRVHVYVDKNSSVFHTGLFLQEGASSAFLDFDPSYGRAAQKGYAVQRFNKPSPTDFAFIGEVDEEVDVLAEQLTKIKYPAYGVLTFNCRCHVLQTIRGLKLSIGPAYAFVFRVVSMHALYRGIQIVSAVPVGSFLNCLLVLGGIFAWGMHEKYRQIAYD